jgi:hypothetical protein
MTLRSVVFAAVLACVSAPGVRAQENAEPSDTIEPSIVLVVTGGRWTQGDKQGFFRVVIRQLGWDHVSNGVQLDWIEENAESQAFIIASSAVLSELSDGFWLLGTPSFTTPEGGPTRMSLPAEHTYSHEKRTFVFEFGSPGRYTPQAAH